MQSSGRPPDGVPSLHSVPTGNVSTQVPEAERRASGGNSTDWQAVLDRLPLEKLDQFLTTWNERGSSERKIQLIGTHVLTSMVIVAGSLLAWKGTIGGEAIVGFFGAALAYLLSRTKGSS